jgi:SAM-dependent methyltransferase
MIFKQISFHDPDGVVFNTDDRVLRRVTSKAAIRLRSFLATTLATDLVREGLLPETHELSLSEIATLEGKKDLYKDAGIYSWFCHEKLPFVSYAYEWVPEMLLDAAQMTLTLAQRLNSAGWDLKDANSSNVVFRGTSPVFVDLCSIVERETTQAYWWPKGQFERHFILPLLAYLSCGLSPSKIHFSHADGLDPESLYDILGTDKWTSGLALNHCTLPVLLAGRRWNTPQSTKGGGMSSDVCMAMQSWQIRSLEKSIKSIRHKLPKPKSNWHSYIEKRGHYSNQDLTSKRQIINRWLETYKPTTVLDVGSNTGEFSHIAAATGASVYALEKDVDSARIAFNRAKEYGFDCQVVLQDIANPSPAMGWRYAEKKSLDQRVKCQVECVLALALVHHWLVSSLIPLPEIVMQLTRWTQKYLVIEYVSPNDPMFETLSAQRKLDFSWLNREVFIKSLKTDFQILDEVTLKSHRILFLCERRI